MPPHLQLSPVSCQKSCERNKAAGMRPRSRYVGINSWIFTSTSGGVHFKLHWINVHRGRFININSWINSWCPSIYILVYVVYVTRQFGNPFLIINLNHFFSIKIAIISTTPPSRCIPADPKRPSSLVPSAP